MKYLIMAFDRTEPGFPIFFWKPSGWGYTDNLLHAGRFSDTTIKQNPELYNNEETKAIEVDHVNFGHAFMGLVDVKRFILTDDKPVFEPVIYCTSDNLQFLGVLDDYIKYRKRRRREG